MPGKEDAHGASAPRRVLPFIYVTLAVVLGFFLIATAWDRLHRAQRAGTLATTGPYVVIRHPQHVGFSAILVGLLSCMCDWCGQRSRTRCMYWWSLPPMHDENIKLAT